MVKPCDQRLLNPSSSVTTRSARSIYPAMRKNSCACPISMITSGSPDALAKTSTTLRGPCKVMRSCPALMSAVFATFSSTSIVRGSSMKGWNASSRPVEFAEEAICAVMERTFLSRNGSRPSSLTWSPDVSRTFLSMTGAKNLTAGSPMIFARAPSSIGPAGRAMVCVAVPLRKSTAPSMLSRADREASVIPTAAATPKAMPSSCRTARLLRLTR